MPSALIPVYLEVGRKRVFACALDWPGWCRSGKDESQALVRLADYAPRYAPVARDAGLIFPDVSVGSLEVVERLQGNATTDFGAPDRPAARDLQPLSRDDVSRLAALLQAAWRLLDSTAARAPAELTKGPRGGGRDRDRVLEHVLGAETSYARRIGVRSRQPLIDDVLALAEHRAAIIEGVHVAAQNPASADSASKGWPAAYAVRRIAWHVLDHAWEIEDRGGLRPAS